MSTRSNVGIKEGDKFKYIYVHFDGYPTGVGRILRTYYNDPAEVKRLIELGDCSILGCTLSPAKEHFDDQTYIDPNGSVFYGRDRGDEGIEAKVEDWSVYYDDVLDDAWIEYVYVFEDGKWTGYKNEKDFDPETFEVIEGSRRLEKIKEEEYEYDD